MEIARRLHLMWLKMLALGLPILIIAFLLLRGYGSHRWQSLRTLAQRRMEESLLPMRSAFFDSSQVEDVPQPVRTYLSKVLRENQPLIQAVKIEQRGSFNMGQTDANWKRFSANQFVTTNPPSFLWDARIRVAPLVDAFVKDAYMEGRGILEAKLLGLIKLVNVSSTPELDRAELMRYLGEAVWFPTALLPTQGVNWQAMDDSHAIATISFMNTEAKLLFEFDKENLVSSVYADTRAMISGKEIKFAAWQGRFWNYHMRDGMLIPLEGEVAWIIEGKRLPYWRGRIEKIEYIYSE